MTDGFPYMALTMEKRSNKLLTRPLKGKGNLLLDRKMLVTIILVSVSAGIIALTLFATYYFGWGSSMELARSVAFTMLSIGSLLYAFPARVVGGEQGVGRWFGSKWLLLGIMGGILMQLVVLYIPIFQVAFKTVPLGFGEWSMVGVGVMILMVIVEFVV